MSGNQQALARALVSLVTAHDDEIARAARRLHDDVAQILSAVGLRLGLLRMDVGGSPELLFQVNESQKLVERAVESVRSLSYDLNPATVERAGLAAALDRLVQSQHRAFHNPIDLTCNLAVKVPAPVARAFYNILHRALDNAVRHSGGTSIRIEVVAQSGGMEARLTDDGKGFDVDEQQRNPSGIGLLLMRHYAAKTDLELDISSAPGRGTIVTARCSG